jgi:hypothetical protein
MATQWVTFRTSSALLHAPLSSAVTNGEGWRAVVLPQYHSFEVLDNWVIDTAHKSEASLGVSSAGDIVYVVAVSESLEPLRFVLGVDGAASDHEAMLRAEVDTLDLDGWTGRVAEAFAAWSVHAPRSVDVSQMVGLIRAPEGDGLAAATALFSALGLHLPEEPPVSLSSLQAGARDKLEQEDAVATRRERKKRKK